jgi:hypothetical protein
LRSEAAPIHRRRFTSRDVLKEMSGLAQPARVWSGILAQGRAFS